MDVIFEKTRMPDGTMIEEVSFYDATPTIIVNALVHATGVMANNEALDRMRDLIREETRCGLST